MIHFFDVLDFKTRTVQPQVAMLADKYIVIGTQYGHIHTISGGIRTWKSYSGAYKALKRYLLIHTGTTK